jgi:hypothetical protein
MQILLKLLLVLLIAGTICFPAQSIWFEASGQAAINNGNKKIARERATQEAIKQALLFAGASVKSVQHMANGLLQDDRFEVRSSGDVNTIELIDEIYNNGFVTVTVRADIFPQNAKCMASDYKKNIVTTWYPITHRQQAAVGSLYDFGKVVADKLQQEFRQYTQYSVIERIEPYYLYPEHSIRKEQALELARKANAQFSLFAQITEFAVEQPKSSGLAFWHTNVPQRNFSLSISLYDGNSGELVIEEDYPITAAWEFELHQPVASSSQLLWQSPYGIAVRSLLQDVAQQIDESVSCVPAYGRILHVQNGQLSINIGSDNGVQKGDSLTLFQLTQFYDPLGKVHQKFNLHPEKVQVSQVFAQTAIVESASGAPLANIQANDFVARR